MARYFEKIWRIWPRVVGEKLEHGKALTAKTYTIKNVIESSSDTQSPSLISWYESRGGNLVSRCSVKYCDNNSDLIGAHVLLEEYPTTDFYFILPMCKTHNLRYNGYLTTKDEVKPVARNWKSTVPKSLNSTTFRLLPKVNGRHYPCDRHDCPNGYHKKPNFLESASSNNVSSRLSSYERYPCNQEICPNVYHMTPNFYGCSTVNVLFATAYLMIYLSVIR